MLRLERSGRLLWRGECIGVVTRRVTGTKLRDVEWKFTPLPHFRTSLRVLRGSLRKLRRDITIRMVEVEREHAQAAERLGAPPNPIRR